MIWVQQSGARRLTLKMDSHDRLARRWPGQYRVHGVMIVPESELPLFAARPSRAVPRSAILVLPEAGIPSFTCPRCGEVSYGLGDILNGYCGSCRDWTGQPL